MLRCLLPSAALALGVLIPATSAHAQRQLGATVSQTDNGVHTHVGRRVTWVCPAITPAQLADAQVWGTDVYSSDSAVCIAAIHAGVLQVGRAGAVTIVIASGADAFASTTRNGVTTKDYGAWGASFLFDRSGEPGQLDWTTTGAGMPASFTDSVRLMCPGGGAASAAIWGTDIYHADSPICMAAVHAGLITRADGGRIWVSRAPGQSAYAATDRNGVQSTAWTADSASFRFGSAPTAIIATALPPAAPGPIVMTPQPAAPPPTVTPPTAAPGPVTPTNRPPTTTSPALDQGLLVGVGISDITGPIAEVVMIGYAEPKQIAGGLHTRLHARAFIFANKKSGKRVVWVSAELGQLFSSVKQGVIRKLEARYPGLYSDANVMLSATHTHSGPGGYSHHAIYNVSIGGFVRQNYDAIVDGITEAIVRAHENLAPGGVSTLTQPLTDATMVNRSKVAFMLNQDFLAAPTAVSAINPDMTLLKIYRSGQATGAIAFHAVHNTSMPVTNHLVSADHKGHAAYLFERQFGSIAPFQKYGAFVAAFPNGAEGDMSPNLNTSALDTAAYGRGVLQGPDADPFTSARIIGTREFIAALGLFNSTQATDVGTDVDFRYKTVLMQNTPVPSSSFTNGAGGKTLCAGAYGVSFMAGAEDGRTEWLSEGLAFGSTIDKEAMDRARTVVIGVASATMPALLPMLTTTGEAFMAASSDQCQYPKPILLPTGFMHWSPDILPFQLFRIGSVAIVGIPGEMTMQAGRRLEAAVRAVLLPLGVQRVLITGLANEYSGYITTPEEYDSQQYEGASTLYGRLTFDAYREAFQALGVAMATGKQAKSGPPAGDMGIAQIEWTPKVDYDWLPIGETFGQILLQPKQTVARGTVARMIYRAGNPRNDLRRNDSYIRIERDSGGGVALAAWDGIPETRLYWSRSYAPIPTENGPIGTPCPGTPCYWSTMDVLWFVPPDAVPGTYHIRVFGGSKDSAGKITPYETRSAAFTVQ